MQKQYSFGRQGKLMNYRSTIVLTGMLFVGMTGYSQQAAGSADGAKAVETPAVNGPAEKPTAAQLAAAAPTPAADGASYVIGPDDVLMVTVWKELTLSGSLTVRPDGKISLPLLGDVQASGVTPMKLADDLTARFKKFITDPTVNVTVVTVNSKRVYMMGEVAHVGPIPIIPGMSPLQAIAAAGGLTPYANQRHIYILRGEQGKQAKIPFDYKKALKNGDMQGITLVPGDTIVVP